MEKLPFIPEQIYHRRNDIHAIYGGNWQGGICPSSSHPFIFIFSGKSGHQHGYLDRWENQNVFSYSGEGQVGDMKFTKGNLSLSNHKEKGKRVFLFEHYLKGYVRFKCELEFLDADYYPGIDKLGNERIAIKFFFNRIGISIPYPKELTIQSNKTIEPIPVYALSQPNITERKGLITSRVGQGAYRKSIIHRWEYKCAVTGFDKLEILIASHIVPWCESNDEERLDVHNGILLSPAYDALFDKHFISFENSGKIILSDAIDPTAYKKIGVTGIEKIKDLSIHNKGYLERHRELIIL